MTALSNLAAHVPELPTTSAPLAAAVAKFIKAEEALAAARSSDGYVPLPILSSRYQAFNCLKIVFEREFPL